MLKPLKFSSKEIKLLWLSDLHDFHDPAWHPTPYESRGFKSAQEHHDWFIKEWYKYVDINTIVFNLGDSNFKDGEGKSFDYLSTLPCKAHYLITGNHLSGARLVYKRRVAEMGLNPEEHEIYPIKSGNITFVGNNLHVYIDYKSVWMSHYAHYIWPEAGKEDSFHLCGHSHSNASELNISAKSLGKVFDCGIDNAVKYNGTPFFTWAEINLIMNHKPVAIKDHHTATSHS